MTQTPDKPYADPTREPAAPQPPVDLAGSLQPTTPDTATTAPTAHGGAVGADWATQADIAAADRDDPRVDHASAPGPLGARPPEADSLLESLGKAITDPVMEASGEADQSDAGVRRHNAAERARAQDAQDDQVRP